MGIFLPPDLKSKVDRLTMGILPVKMKAIYLWRSYVGDNADGDHETIHGQENEIVNENASQ